MRNADRGSGGGLRSVAAILAVIWAAAGSAAAPPEGARIDRPDPAGTPTTVAFAIAVLDISSIDSAQQCVTADVGLVLRWRDPRLARAGAGLRAFNLSDVWNPGVQVVNQRSVSSQLPEVVDVEADGTVYYRQRYSGQFSNRIQVLDFPFDEHDFVIRFASVQDVAKQVEFTHEPLRAHGGLSDQLLVTDWAVTSWRMRGTVLEMPLSLHPRPAMEFIFHAERRAEFYVLKLLVPLTLVVLMSWVVFWLDPSRIDAQIGTAGTAVLTLIAYRFTFDSLLPPVSYMTRVDYFFFGSTALVFLSLLEVLVTSQLVGADRIAVARRVDRWSRGLFPLLFAGLACWSFLL